MAQRFRVLLVNFSACLQTGRYTTEGHLLLAGAGRDERVWNTLKYSQMLPERALVPQHWFLLCASDTTKKTVIEEKGKKKRRGLLVFLAACSIDATYL